MEIPDVRYAKTDDGLHLAYQHFGEGPPLVIVPPLISNIELWWEFELFRRPFEHLARSVRVLQFDKRGIGSSDRFEQTPTLEQRMGDIAAVMDAVDLERASLMAASEGALMAQLFAERNPERVDRLVLTNSLLGSDQYREAFAYFRDGDEPVVAMPERELRLDRLVEMWGRDGSLMVEQFIPGYSGDEQIHRWVARLQRQSASPADIRRQIDSVLEIDGADPSRIHAPTLVQLSTRDRVVPAFAGRWLADRITGATLQEMDSPDHYLFVAPTWRESVDAALEFVLGAPVGAAPTRRFATVVFSDIVSSTSRSAQVGDREWHEVKEAHDRVARKVVGAAGGRVVKSTGDGVLATFEAPSSALGAARALRGELAVLGLPIRVGIHAGEVEVHDDGDVSGIAVNLAARVEAAADTDEILVSSTVHDLALGSGWEFTERGEHVLKGFEGTWSLFALTG